MALHRRQSVVKKSLKRVYAVLLNEVEEFIETELNKDKRVWVRDWISRRDTHGASALLLTELATEDLKEYMTILRMTPENFFDLLELVSEKLTRNDTFMRDSLTPQIKLEATLYFLATGNSYTSLQHLFRISKAAISKFIPEVCDAVFESLKNYIKVSLL